MDPDPCFEGSGFIFYCKENFVLFRHKLGYGGSVFKFRIQFADPVIILIWIHLQYYISNLLFIFLGGA